MDRGGYGLIAEIKKAHEKGQPVLVGTTSIEKSEMLSQMLKQKKVLSQMLKKKKVTKSIFIRGCS